jgi:hypothetical protein
MLAARVEQKNGMTKDYKKWRDALDKESPIQAGCETRTSGSVRGAEKQFSALLDRGLATQPYSATEVDGWQHKLSRVSQTGPQHTGVEWRKLRRKFYALKMIVRPRTPALAVGVALTRT